jgi:phytoene dehydrogenase-like protein
LANKVRLNNKTIKALGDLDLIIIGSGMSGLTTGSIMAQAGYKVCVLEKHDQAGGCLHTFEEKGYEFDTGLHYIGAQVGVRNSQVRKIFDTVTGGFVTWDRLEDTYDEAICGDEKFVWNSNYQKTKADLKAAFPEDVGAINAYFRALKFTMLAIGPWIGCKLLPYRWMRVLFGKALNFPMKWYCGGSAKDFLKRLTKNEKLIGVLTYLYGDMGAPPGEIAWPVHSLLAAHWEGGAYYPHYGPSAIAMSACEVIRKNGGQVLVNADVTKLLFDDIQDMGPMADPTQKRSGRCWGVEVSGHRLFADQVVSCCGARNTFMKLLPERYQNKLGDIIPKMKHSDTVAASSIKQSVPALAEEEARAQYAVHLKDTNMVRKSGKEIKFVKENKEMPRSPFASTSLFASSHSLSISLSLSSLFLPFFPQGPSCAMLTLFIGFDCDIKELGCPKLNKWIFPTWDHDENMRKFKQDKEAPFPAVFIGSGSVKDDSWNERWGKTSTLEVLAPVEHSWFVDWKDARVKNRGGEYDTFKEYWTNRLLAVLYEQYPQLEGKVSFKDLGTPLSCNYYLGVDKGEIYGLTHTPERIVNSTADLSPYTDIEGLYMGGQDIVSAGIVGALMSGVVTVAALSKVVAAKNAAMFL